MSDFEHVTADKKTKPSIMMFQVLLLKIGYCLIEGDTGSFSEKQVDYPWLLTKFNE